MHFIMLKLDPEFAGDYAVCWFPYTLGEMKEFKLVTLRLFDKLQQQGLLPENPILGKSVLETAQGRRVWEMLRFLSDYALRHAVAARYPDKEIPDMPDFISTLVDLKNEKEAGGSAESAPIVRAIPAPANILLDMVSRNRIGAEARVNMEV